MFFITLLSSLIKFLAGPLEEVFDGLLVVIDKGVYQLVQSSFTLFMIMCQLNLNVIYDMAASLVDRLKALIIVFIIFKVGVALIQYMLNPDKAAQGSKKLLLNILIAAAMLVSYNFVFSVFNEASMMILGKPENYKYTTLSQIAGVTNESDEGLIMRLFFGLKSDKTSIKTVEGIGNNIAFNSLCATFPDKKAEGLQCKYLISAIGDGTTNSNYNIKKLGNVTKMLGKTIDGHPGIALILGLYMVYSVIKASIEIGVRMFKLMLMQLVAPIAIISVASDEGVKAKPFANFIGLYGTIYVSAFTRIVAILLVTVFVSKVFTQIDTLVGNITANGYGLWVMVICIVAGYRFAGEIPKMIDKIFATNLGQDPDKGFGKFLTTLGAVPVLGAVGAVRGAVGAENWYSGLYGAGAGALSGMASAFKGNTIPDKVKAFQAGQDKINQRQAGMNEARTLGAYLQGRFVEGKGFQARQLQRLEDEAARYETPMKLVEAYDKAQTDAIKDQEVDWDSIKTEDQAHYVKDKLIDATYKGSKEDFWSNIESNGIDKTYDDAKNKYESIMADSSKDAATKLKEQEAFVQAEREARSRAFGIWKQAHNLANTQAVKDARSDYEEAVAKLGGFSQTTLTDKDSIEAARLDTAEQYRQKQREVDQYKKRPEVLANTPKHGGKK